MNLENYLDFINRKGLSLERAYKLMEIYIDTFCKNRQLTKSIDKRALPFLASQFLKVYNKNCSSLSYSEKQAYFSLELSAFNPVSISKDIYLASSNTLSDCYEEAFNLSKVAFYDDTTCLKKVLLFKTKKNNYVLSNNGLFQYSADNLNRYNYYRFNEDGTIASNTFVDKRLGIMKTDREVYIFNRHPDFNISYEGCSREELIEQIYEPKVIGKNLKITPKAYDVSMYALTDKGRVRPNNEDSVIAISHPLDDAIKLLAVADGMGGYSNGEFASSFTIKELEIWFKELSLKKFNNMDNLKKSLNDVVLAINSALQNKIKESGKEMGTTLTVAIVTYDKTLIGNIGDSRCYLLNGISMEQVTEDDSLAYYLYKENKIENKDDIRFYRHNNQITQGLGVTDVELKTNVINNNSYSKLLLLTDGVTDCLSDDKIKLIANTSRKEYILKDIIDEAVNVEQVIPNINLPESLISYPKPGKDNASGAILIKR